MAEPLCCVFLLRFILQGFQHQELFQAIDAEFPAVSGLFASAERGKRIETTAINIHLPCPQSPGHLFGPPHIT